MPTRIVYVLPLVVNLLGLITTSAAAQSFTLEKALGHTDSLFSRVKPRPTVLLLGVFHFAGEQVDVNTTPPDLRVNMLSPERQRQVEDLVGTLAAFKPTKIAIEAPPEMQPKVDSLYRLYRAGQPLDGIRLRTQDSRVLEQADERIQLGFRLARLLNLDRVNPVDAQPFRYTLSPIDSVVTYEKYKDQYRADSSYAYWSAKYDHQAAYKDSLAYYLPLKDYLSYLNTPRIQERSIGRWLVATKRGTNEEPVGADGFITRYSNRNIRIYSNIQRVVTSDQDRILVIFGATHMYQLRQLFAASPEFALEDVSRYLTR